MPEPLDILRVMARVGAAPDQAWPLARLADTSGWSAAHLHRSFRRVTHTTPKVWTSIVRVRAAVEALWSTDLPVHEVARLHGFASHEVFCRTMRRVLGLTPVQARAFGKNPHLRHALCLTMYHLSLEPQESSMSVDIRIENRTPVTFLCKRKTVAPDGLQGAMAECLPAVFQHCMAHGVQFAGPPTTRYIEMTPGSMTIEAGMPVAAAEASGDLLVTELPGGELAVAVHEGPYDTLGQTHAAMWAWAEANGRERAGGPWEVYLTDPGEVPDPADWRTEICMPLKA